MTADAPAPILSIVVPAFNAERDLPRALAGLGEFTGIEVLVVDDGSTDQTAQVAAAHARLAPHIVRVLSQTNRGHGGAITAGIAAARGTYLKVLDADDWLDPASLRRVLGRLRDLEDVGGVDLLITDFVHERLGRSSRSARFSNVFPQRRVFGWDDTAAFRSRQFLMMHALIARTEMLRHPALALPEHTYYVDSLFLLEALRRSRRLAYENVPLYRYLIGRAGQSIDARTMVARADQQVRVNRLALGLITEPDASRTPPALREALLHYVERLCAVTAATLARSGTPEHLALRREFWQDLHRDDPRVHARMRRTLLGRSANLPGAAGRKVTGLAYSVARRVAGFS